MCFNRPFAEKSQNFKIVNFLKMKVETVRDPLTVENTLMKFVSTLKVITKAET